MELATDPPRGAAGAGRLADGAAADAPPSAREAAADGNVPPYLGSRLRERLLEPSPVQRRVQRTIPHAADALQKTRCRDVAERRGIVLAAPLVSSAFRLGGPARIPAGAPDRRRRIR